MYKKFQQKTLALTNFVFLHAMYFIGIGITAIIGKLFGKQFLDFTPAHSSWKEHSGNDMSKTMY